MTRMIIDTSGLKVQHIPQENELVIEVHTEPLGIEEGLKEVHAELMIQGQTQLFADEFCQRAYNTLATMLAVDILRSRIKTY